MKSRRSPRALSAGALPLALALSLGACTSPMPGQLGHDLQVLETCPEGLKVASITLVDGTGTVMSELGDELNLELIESVVRRTAICGGAASVSAFSSGSASTAKIYEGVLELHGATDIARLKKLDELVAEVMTVVRENYAPAIESLPDNGTDVVGQYRLIAEYAAQLPDFAVESYISTDGLTNQGVNTELELTKEQAVTLADGLALPDLTGVKVTVEGLGRVAGAPLSSTLVEGIVAFYDRVCENTGASSCLSVTDRKGL